jgi:hypothetical protein
MCLFVFATARDWGHIDNPETHVHSSTRNANAVGREGLRARIAIADQTPPVYYQELRRSTYAGKP